MKQVASLIMKEFKLEFRQKANLFGLLLYVISTVFVCYQSFGGGFRALKLDTWNALFWIIVLFASLNAIQKSFLSDGSSRFLLYYSLVSPQKIILSKLLYNSIQLCFLSVVAYIIYSLVLSYEVADVGMFIIILLLGAIGFACCFTLIAAIAAKASNNISLMAILSFPVVIPMIILVLKLSRNAIDGLAWGVQWEYLFTLLAIDAILVVLSVFLFPYVWRS